MVGRNEKVEMSYANYDRDIRGKFNIQIHKSWPLGVKFTTPSGIGKASDLRALHEGLVTGECCWKKMDPEEIAELKVKLSAMKPKERQERSDKGGVRAGTRKKRPRADENSDPATSEVAQPAAKRGKRKTKAQVAATLPLTYKSRETIEDTDDEEDSGDVGRGVVEPVNASGGATQSSAGSA